MAENIATVYQSVTFKRFVSELTSAYLRYREEKHKTESDISVCVGKTGMTIRNCMNLDKQIVKDEVITALMKCIGMDGEIKYKDGKKYYYISIV